MFDFNADKDLTLGTMNKSDFEATLDKSLSKSSRKSLFIYLVCKLALKTRDYEIIFGSNDEKYASEGYITRFNHDKEFFSDFVNFAARMSEKKGNLADAISLYCLGKVIIESINKNNHI